LLPLFSRGIFPLHECSVRWLSIHEAIAPADTLNKTKSVDNKRMFLRIVNTSHSDFDKCVFIQFLAILLLRLIGVSDNFNQHELVLKFFAEFKFGHWQ